MSCFGRGKSGSDHTRLSLPFTASIPVIRESELDQETPLSSFMCGSFVRMTNCRWKGCRVTVKDLHCENSPRCELRHLQDLLTSEQQYCCETSHPHLLLLMAVCCSADLLSTKLLYERVNVGSLSSVLHQRREEVPVPLMRDLLALVLQVCEALIYLHSRSLVLRALSSHTVLIVHPGVAKVTGLGFMVPSEGSCSCAPPHVPVPLSLINWAAPETVMCQPCTDRADVYSVCALLQEIYTGAVPWGSTEPYVIKQAVEAGQALIAHPTVPFYCFLRNGLRHSAHMRTGSLDELCYRLRRDVKTGQSMYKAEEVGAVGRRDYTGGGSKAVGPPSEYYIAPCHSSSAQRPLQEDGHSSQESDKLERLFKSFAGIQSDSEESTHHHTPESLDSEEELEFSQPRHTIERLSESHLAGEDWKRPESIAPVHSCFPDCTEIADLSSISCSPAQRVEWVGSVKAPPTLHSRGCPSSISTPLSPKGRRARPQDDPADTSTLPQLQILMHSTSSQTTCMESYDTASAGDGSTSGASVSSVLRSPAVRDDSKEETGVGFITASSDAPQTSGEMERPVHQETEEADRQGQQEAAEEEEVSSAEEEVSSAEGVSEGKGRSEDDHPCQTDEENVNSSDANSNATTPQNTDQHDDTERASATLDDELQRMSEARAPPLDLERTCTETAELV